MLKFRLDDTRLERKMRRLTRLATGSRPLMLQVAGIMKRSTEENFRVEGRPGWKRLKPSTKKARLRKGKLGKILQVSGALARSITSYANNKEAVVGSNLSYARIQQLGGKGKQSAIPARPYLKLTDREEKEIRVITGRYLSGRSRL